MHNLEEKIISLTKIPNAQIFLFYFILFKAMPLLTRCAIDDSLQVHKKQRYKRRVWGKTGEPEQTGLNQLLVDEK